MSEILIKNMALPKQGWKRLILLPDGEVREICGDEAVRATDARAVELPEHGDLIDRRKLWKDTEGLGEYCCDRDFISLCDAISEAPMVLGASK